IERSEFNPSRCAARAPSRDESKEQEGCHTEEDGIGEGPEPPVIDGGHKGDDDECETRVDALPREKVKATSVETLSAHATCAVNHDEPEDEDREEGGEEDRVDWTRRLDFRKKTGSAAP